MEPEKEPGQVWADEEWIYICTSKRNDALVDDLRRRVPKATYDKETRSWRAPLAFQDIVAALFHKHCKQFPDRLEAAYHLLFLVPGAPIEIVEAAFKAYVAVYEEHPMHQQMAKEALRRIKEAVEGFTYGPRAR